MRNLILFLALVTYPAQAFAQITFTGSVALDFAEVQNCFVDDGLRVGLPPGVTSTGFDLEQVCFFYDGETDILYIGAQAYGGAIFGDADGDSNPSASSVVGISDFADLSSTETFVISLDLNGDSESGVFDASTVDVLIGVSDSGSLANLGVYEPSVAYNPNIPGSGFGTSVGRQVTTTLYASPSGAIKDLEFQVNNFSALADIIGELADQPAMQIHTGSTAAAGIGSDFLPSPGSSTSYSLFDFDGDGLQDWEELELGTDPADADTDNDGVSDGTEVEGVNATDPLDADSDDDTLIDGEEDVNANGRVDLGETNPNDADSDNDGLTDGVEVTGLNPTDPLDSDTDGDALTDGQEDVNANGQVDIGETDPNIYDTDAGGVNDGQEIINGTDPLDPTDDAMIDPTGQAGGGVGYDLFQGGGVGCSMAQMSDTQAPASFPYSLFAVAGLILWKARRRVKS